MRKAILVLLIAGMLVSIHPTPVSANIGGKNIGKVIMFVLKEKIKEYKKDKNSKNNKKKKKLDALVQKQMESEILMKNNPVKITPMPTVTVIKLPTIQMMPVRVPMPVIP